ncbi:MAG: N-formylglutamate amidohydrolase [Marinilabiliaceae bacterium]|nr:N-formylglutamate amidohydrolase [Marinilabiliaceae bacterium]
MYKIDNIVLNIPHSSAEGVLESGWSIDILPHVRRWTDWDTDKIFCDFNKQIKPVIFPYSRFVCDTERLLNDPMNAIGQGIIYERFDGVCRNMDEVDKSAIMRLYHRHIGRLRSKLTRTSLLIDCHSFPSDLYDVDICIGFNNDWSKPCYFLIDTFKRHFEQRGYTVALNSPYSNSISPTMPFYYPSIMIELNKRVYKEDIMRIKSAIHALYLKVL